MKIALIFNKFREDTTGIYFERALTQLGIKYDHFWTRDLAKVERKYDLYFRIDDSSFDSVTPPDMRPKVLWANDTHLKGTMKGLLKEAKNSNFVFCPLMQGVREFAQHGIKATWLSQGCDPEIHRRLSLPRDYAIGFVGTDGGVPRKFYLQELRERYPYSYIGHAPYLKMSEIYSRSKIGFNYTNQQDLMRSYEIMACGALLLMYLTSDENSAQLGYQEGVHFVGFGHPRELFEKIRYYLTHDEERQRIAEAGYQLTVTSHRYVDRMRELFKIIGVSTL
jgi:spore maturation protein CgeB